MASVTTKRSRAQARSYKSNLTPEQQAIYEWTLADLKKSGLTEKDIHVKPYTETESAALGLHKTGACYTITYFDEHGKPTKMFRARFRPATYGFAKLVKQKDKYLQPANTGCEVFLSHLIEWLKVLNDPTLTIYVVEGEKKAAWLCKCGSIAIGIGGVWSFGSKNDKLHHFLQRLAAGGRTVIIAHDSDVATNPHNLLGENSLATLLSNHGAVVKARRIPPGPDGSKRGADDLTHEEFESLAPEDIWLGLGNEYAELSGLYGCLLDEAKFFNYPTQDRPKIEKWTRAQFCDVVESQRRVTIELPTQRTDKNGKTVTSTHKQEKPVARFWVDSKWRDNYRTMVYKPGADSVIDQCFNRWPGWGCEPVEGDISPFVAVLEHVVPKEGERTYFLDWLAYPLQRPGAKIPIAIILISKVTGIGKSSLMRAMDMIYGDMNTSWIDEDAIKDSFYEWLPNRQLIIANEINGINGRKYVAKLKDLVSEEKTRVNIKYVSAEKTDNKANFVFMTNDIDAFQIDANDRRFFVIDSPAGKLPKKLRDRFNTWINDAGPSALFGHLLRRDLSKFDPYEEAPITEGKQLAIGFSRSQIENWAHIFATDPGSLVIHEESPVRKVLTTHTVEELMKMFGERRGFSDKALLRALRDEGFKRALSGTSVRTNDGKSYRLWISPCHVGEWEHASEAKHRELFERERKDIPIYKFMKVRKHQPNGEGELLEMPSKRKVKGGL